MAEPAGEKLVASVARSSERAAAFRLLFASCADGERETRVATALNLLSAREFEADGVLVVREGTQLVGAMMCVPAPGAAGLVWPPRCLRATNRPEVEDALIQHATSWLRGRGAKVIQALLSDEEAMIALPLERNGYKHVTQLWYLRHRLRDSGDPNPAAPRLHYQPYDQGSPAPFHETLLRTYEQTHDCPELNGVRTVSEILAGHRAQGLDRMNLWWLALDGARPVGVLLLAELPAQAGWDISYLGLVPERRGDGLGRELGRKALDEALVAGASQLSVSVDRRNDAACKLYLALGFQPYERREVYLALPGP
jgi:ribosomal protein S18 acetylase RimI-like enzyme